MAWPVEYNKNTNNFLQQHYMIIIQSHSAPQNNIVENKVTEMKKCVCSIISYKTNSKKKHLGTQNMSKSTTLRLGLK